MLLEQHRTPPLRPACPFSAVQGICRRAQTCIRYLSGTSLRDGCQKSWVLWVGVALDSPQPQPLEVVQRPRSLPQVDTQKARPRQQSQPRTTGKVKKSPTKEVRSQIRSQITRMRTRRQPRKQMLTMTTTRVARATRAKSLGRDLWGTKVGSGPEPPVMVASFCSDVLLSPPLRASVHRLLRHLLRMNRRRRTAEQHPRHQARMDWVSARRSFPERNNRRAPTHHWTRGWLRC
mmetsp:Transcript_57774/g.122914  ORF Transcript_57774/g.122914 Transcript_57774/m.122914 type:complete len:233 (-) Transcript_57774:1211-1909(-)